MYYAFANVTAYHMVRTTGMTIAEAVQAGLIFEMYCKDVSVVSINGTKINVFSCPF